MDTGPLADEPALITGGLMQRKPDLLEFVS